MKSIDQHIAEAKAAMQAIDRMLEEQEAAGIIGMTEEEKRIQRIRSYVPKGGTTKGRGMFTYNGGKA
jgi:hypothetical protein